MDATPSTDRPHEHLNEVRLVGRVSADPEHRVLPSGDELWTFRLVVDRPPDTAQRTRVDTLDCAAWTARSRRSVSRWSAGDLVEVRGRVRRRFYTAGATTASRV